MTFHLEHSVNQFIYTHPSKNIQVTIKREDQIHPIISGNKYRKLIYNLEEARRLKSKTLLSYGGAFSNHIAAVAAAGKAFGFQTIGIIRGEELVDKVSSNPTLDFAKNCGMQFKFMSRSDYRDKSSETNIQKLKSEFGDFYMIPEGGTNNLAIKGCEEILTETDKNFDYVCCSVGTGGTISGIINSSHLKQKILAFPALKGEFLKEEISKFATKSNWELISNYHFDGYAKVNSGLIRFINDFKVDFQIQLDPIYTGKMMFGIFDLINNGYFPENSTVLAIHTGGLQGIQGMNLQLKKKKSPLIC